MPQLASSALLSALLIACLARAAVAQCPLEWESAAPHPQLAGNAKCSIVWDPDGAGPLPSRLVVGGSNLLAGTVPTPQRVMTWDGTQWQGLGGGPGTTGEVTVLTVWTNNVLVAAGTFTGGGFNHVAMWNGVTWSPVGVNLGLAPVAVVDWNGTLVAGANGVSSPVLTTFNGSAWAAMTPAPQLTFLRSMLSYGGNLCVAGRAPAGGVLERWNGSSWLPSITANNWIHSLAARSFQFLSTLYVGGDFTTIGGTAANRVASTPGGTTPVWSAVGNGPPTSCSQLHVRATSALGVAVVANHGGFVPHTSQLVGSSFAVMGGNASLSSISFYAGSYYGTVVSTSAAACVRYDGTAWVPLSVQSITGEVRALTASGADVIAGGTIQSTSSTALNLVARWNGATFLPLGAGMSGTSVDALLTLGNGDIVAGGLFSAAGGVSSNNVARWNGSAWAPLGAGTDQQVLALARMPNGDVIAGGKFTSAGGVSCARIARWNGSSWSPLGSGMNGDVHALAVRSDGVLFACGAFTGAGGTPCSRIARWNGAAWSPLGSGCNADVHALTVRPNDDVVAVGAFVSAGGLFAERCARWTTADAWAAMGASSTDPSPPRSVCALANGDVVAGRGFHPPLASPDVGISRWNGVWIPLDGGLAAAVPGNSVAVRALVQRADGALIVGGDFAVANGLAARGLAKLSTTCPPVATPTGTGCTAAGPLVLTADTLPWLGATLRTTTTGIAPVSLCLAVTGFAQASIPLPSVLAEGQPGCTLLASPDILDVLLPDAAGSVHTALALANQPSLLGGSFFQQSIPLEFDLQMTLVAVRASNALALTIGTL